MSIMEGMASRLAVVASRIGGIPEIIEDRITGRLYDAGNVSMLAGVLDELVRDPAHRAALGRNAREQVANRTFAAQAATIEALFGKVLASSAPPPHTAKPIIGILGDCRGRTADPDLTDLPRKLRDRSLLIPTDWLTAEQEQRCAGLRHYYNEGGLNGAIQRLGALAFGLLWPILPGQARAKLVARDRRQWPNFLG